MPTFSCVDSHIDGICSQQLQNPITADLSTSEPVPGNVKKGDGPPGQQRGKKRKAEQKPWEITTLEARMGLGSLVLGRRKKEGPTWLPASYTSTQSAQTPSTPLCHSC